MKDFDGWATTLVSTLASTDRRLADEIRALHGLRAVSRAGLRALPASLRNIVLRVGRPVLAIVGDAARLEFADAESAVWRSRLQACAPALERAARAVGRIEVTGMPGVAFVGTGWLVDQDVIVTNRHVARLFTQRGHGRLAFRRRTTASIDFLEEAGRPDAREFPIVDVLHIEDDAGPDVALLRIAGRGGDAPAPPIPLATEAVKPEQQVAVIGYPARDSRVPDAELLQSIFGDVYEKKRLAPGQITGTRRGVVCHDCSTLGGNSGSVVVDLATGRAVGLHFAGRYLQANYAVPASIVAASLDRLGHPSTARPNAAASLPAVPAAATGSTEPIVESTPADYAGRKGYTSTFLGPRVPLPIVRNTRDVLTFTSNRRRQSVLRYQHFSVVMSRTRRLCIYSAVNIDGRQPRRARRPAWRLDGRIPAAQQIRDECYGNEPLFARGHMTRREDPIWGTPDAAELGNVDSMHVTNTVPQKQPFNAGIWLGLESYALEHARTDRMRISVFTGPFLLADDPVRAGVRIPRSFWKVIAFVHDDAGTLCATGYTMSQQDFLRDDEFVFGRHQTAQVRIAAIEQRARLSFGRLAALDPLKREQRSIATPLTDLSQVRFV